MVLYSTVKKYFWIKDGVITDNIYCETVFHPSPGFLSQVIKNFTHIDYNDIITVWPIVRVSKNRVKWLMNKYKSTRKGDYTDPEWKGVKVTDAQLEEETKARKWEMGKNFIILGNIPMDEDEEAYANLHYKFRETPKVDTHSFELKQTTSP